MAYLDSSGVTQLTSAIKNLADASYLQKDAIPSVTSDDNGKVLQVTNGKWDKVTPESELPSGGSAGQVLAKHSAADGDAEWTNIPTELPAVEPSDNGKVLQVANGAWSKGTLPSGLPSGGSTGQVLAKQSAADDDADWADIPTELPAVTASDNGKVLQVANGAWGKSTPPRGLPTGGTQGQILSIDNHLDPVWSDPPEDDGESVFIPTFGSLATVSLGTTWAGDGPYTSTVTVTGYTVTANTMVSILPTSGVIHHMIEDGVTNLFITNTNGTLTATAVGSGFTSTVTLQVLCTESDVNAAIAGLPTIVGDGVLDMLGVTDLTDAINTLYADTDGLKNSVGTLTPAATASDIGKALIVKTIDSQTGKPSSYEYGVAGGGASLPTGGTNGQVLTKNSSTDGDASWANAPTELPSVSASDNGKVLTVANGAWGKAAVPTELPAVTATDNGRVLQVTNGAWAKGEAPSGGPFVVTITGGQGAYGNAYTYTTDHTVTEIYNAYTAGRAIEARFITNPPNNSVFDTYVLQYASPGQICFVLADYFTESVRWKKYVFIRQFIMTGASSSTANYLSAGDPPGFGNDEWRIDLFGDGQDTPFRFNLYKNCQYIGDEIVYDMYMGNLSDETGYHNIKLRVGYITGDFLDEGTTEFVLSDFHSKRIYNDDPAWESQMEILNSVSKVLFSFYTIGESEGGIVAKTVKIETLMADADGSTYEYYGPDYPYRTITYTETPLGGGQAASGVSF